MLPPPAEPRRLMLVLSSTLLLAICFGGCGAKDRPQNQQADPSATTDPAKTNASKTDLRTEVAALRKQLRDGDSAGCEKKVLALLAAHPSDSRLLTVAAEIALANNQPLAAADRYAAAAAGLNALAAKPLLVHGANAAVAGSDYMRSIELLRTVVANSPDDPLPRRELTGLLLGVGATSEAQQHLEHLLFMANAGIEELVTIADRTRTQVREEWIAAALAVQPKNLRPQVGLAELKLNLSDWPAALQLAAPVIKQHPDYLPAWLAEGRALVGLGRLQDVPEWLGRAPEHASDHPDYWLTVALATSAAGEPRAAARALWECLRRNPGHSEAVRQFPILLQQAGEPELSVEADAYATAMEQMLERLDYFVRGQKRNQLVAYQIAQRMQALGRHWEAEGWARAGLSLTYAPVAELPAFHQQCLAKLKPGLPLVTPDQHPDRWAAKMDKLPLPALQTQLASLPTNTTRARNFDPQSSHVEFANEASSRGINFSYISGDDPQVQGMWIYQANGSGVAVIDYDLNGWPDLYFPQAGGKTGQRDSLPNMLFRNDLGQFKEVAALAHADDRGFGQGATVGDFNDDGFPDLMVANVGPTTLYRNNGDGSFTDVTASAGISGDRWNTSLAIADLDGDGIPDIYEATYCLRGSTFEIPCYGGEDGKKKVTCVPTAFAADEDHFWKGQGDGTFVDRSEAMLQTSLAGRGLGLLVADFDGQPGLEVFVSNDMSPNHFWVAHKTVEGVTFIDEAGRRGMANDARGRPQASMGIASGDPDRDGDLDLEVTAFEDEPDAYYVQVSPGIFEDRAPGTGLGGPSYAPLAFGDQFADFDGDGFVDLFVANGHVYDYGPNEDGQFRQRPQLYSYGDKWVERTETTLGPFFQQEHVGRGLQLLDAQCDGWPDLAFVDLVAPSSLLINRSKHKTEPLTLELVATTTPREAVGARVEIVNSDLPDVRWVTAGDGFEGANEKKLWFAIPPKGTVDVRVTWPNGTQQTYSQLTSGSYLLRENESEPIARILPAAETP